MKKIIVTVSMLVLMLAGQSWAAEVLADYSYECDVLPTAAGWTDIELEADMTIVDVDPVNDPGNKAIHWESPLTGSGDYRGFEREMIGTQADFTYEISLKTRSTGTAWNQYHFSIDTVRLGGVGGKMAVESGSTLASRRALCVEYQDGNVAQTTGYLDGFRNGGFQKLRTVWDWTAANAYTVTWLHDDGVAAGTPGYDSATGFNVLFTQDVVDPDLMSYSSFRVRTKTSSPENQDAWVDYVRWVDQAVDISDDLVGPTTSAFLHGDANNDGWVTAGDFASVQSNFGDTGADDGTLPGDANGDGTVSAGDFSTVQTNFGNGEGLPAPQVTPEPATMSLLALGGMLLIKRRRKQ